MPNTAEQLEQLARGERRVAMATLIAARGGSPRPLGAKLFVGEGGRLVGSVSIGGCVDARVVEHGERLLRENRAERVTVAVDDAEALELGLTCGAEFDLLVEPVGLERDNTIVVLFAEAARLSRAGRRVDVVTDLGSTPVQRALFSDGRLVTGSPSPAVRDAVGAMADVRRSGLVVVGANELFVEHLISPDTLVLVGASDVGAALTRFARELGFRLVVIDGRERYASRERFALADDVLVGMPSELVRPYLTEGAFIVLAAHEYKYELPILREALRAPVRYVGMLAGRKRAESVRSLLRADGVSDDDIARLHSPIGLDIGGREPEEIALSIAAELIAVRERKPIAMRAAAASAPETASTSAGPAEKAGMRR